MVTLTDFLNNNIDKRPINEYNSFVYDERNGSRLPKTYNDDELNQLAKKAFDEGKDVFYADRVPYTEDGGTIWDFAEPKYEYYIKGTVTEKDIEHLHETAKLVDNIKDYVLIPKLLYERLQNDIKRLENLCGLDKKKD